MHLIEVCLPSAAASFLGYSEENIFFMKWGNPPSPPIKKRPKPWNVKLFLAFCFVTHGSSSNVPKGYYSPPSRTPFYKC